MKIAVYTIALNEEQFVERWAASAKDADYILIADTGSTDRTRELALGLGVNVIDVSVKPWRFDVARNASLAALPADIDMCIALDMDEVLLPGWRQHLEQIGDHVTRPRYTYTWSWKADGNPDLQYGGDKIHRRAGYRWKHPVHETLVPYGQPEIQEWIGLEIHHYPDGSKPRSQYYPLLAMAVAEDPYDDRNSHYYARELMYAGKNEEAAAEFKRHLALPTAVWPPERAQSYRYLAKVEPASAEEWLLKAVKECPRREPLVDLAQHYFNSHDWESCLKYAEQATLIIEKPLDYLCEDYAWGSAAWDLAAICCYWLGDRDKALEYGQKALELSPNDKRLQGNLAYFRS